MHACLFACPNTSFITLQRCIFFCFTSFCCGLLLFIASVYLYISTRECIISPTNKIHLLFESDILSPEKLAACGSRRAKMEKQNEKLYLENYEMRRKNERMRKEAERLSKENQALLAELKQKLLEVTCLQIQAGSTSAPPQAQDKNSPKHN